MSKDVTVRVIGDTTDIDTKIALTQTKVDDLVVYWGMTRQEIMTGINTVFMSMNYMVSSVRVAVRMVGGTLDPVQNASLTMIQGAVSAALAIAGMFTATGILAGVGLGLMLVAAELSFLSSAKVLAEMTAARDQIADAEANLAAILATRTPFGGM